MDFNSLLALMLKKNASDMFITAGMPPSLKIAGRVVPVTQRKLTPEQTHATITAIMTSDQQEEFETTRECNFAISAKNIGRFRVSAFYQRNNSGMVLRRITTKIPSIDELNLPPILKDFAMTQRGLIIFVGATGTGKSTSLASMVGFRNKNSTGHIITIEDPIEYIHSHEGCVVTQREVGIDTESYDVALRNTLRQAPDVILVGEVRQRETMDHAIAFAETGHLCLTTLHANNANQAMDRIVNFFPSDRRNQLFMDLSLNLKAIIAQQLIPTPDGKGRVIALEILVNTPHVSDLIRKGAVNELKDIMKRSREQGMQTFDQHLFELYKEGKIAYEDAIRYADSANEVRLLIKLDSSDGDRFASTPAASDGDTVMSLDDY